MLNSDAVSVKLQDKETEHNNGAQMRPSTNKQVSTVKRKY